MAEAFDIDALSTPVDAGQAPAQKTGGFDIDALSSPVDPVAQNKGLLANIGGRLQERGQQFRDIHERQTTDQQNVLSSTLQTFGTAAGAGFDIIGEGLKAGIDALPEGFKEEFKGNVQETFDAINSTETGRKALEALKSTAVDVHQRWVGFKEENPVAAKNIESVVNIAAFLAPVGPKARPTTPLGNLASKVKGKAAAQSQVTRNKFAADLVSPKKTPTVLAEEARRTTEVGRGPFRKNVVTPTPQETAMAREVMKISGAKKSNTIQGNLNAVDKRITELSKTLENDLLKNTVIVPRGQVRQSINNTVARLVADNPTIVSDPALQRMAERVGEKAVEFLDLGLSNPLGILKARRKFDAWILKNKPKAFDSASNTLSESARAVRSTMNDAIEQHAPSVGVKNSLRSQSLLINAADNIAPKAASEANVAWRRAWQNAAKVTPIRNQANADLAVAFGMGGLGAAAKFAPFVTGVGAAIITVGASGKLVMSPVAKRGMARLLGFVDKAILSSKEPSMIKQLRADRATLIEILQNIEVQKEE